MQVWCWSICQNSAAVNFKGRLTWQVFLKSGKFYNYDTNKFRYLCGQIVKITQTAIMVDFFMSFIWWAYRRGYLGLAHRILFFKRELQKGYWYIPHRMSKLDLKKEYVRILITSRSGRADLWKLNIVKDPLGSHFIASTGHALQELVQIGPGALLFLLILLLEIVHKQILGVEGAETRWTACRLD